MMAYHGQRKLTTDVDLKDAVIAVFCNCEWFSISLVFVVLCDI